MRMRLFLALCVALTPACTSPAVPGSPALERRPLVVVDMDGARHDLDRVRAEKPVALVFWSTW